MAKERKFWEILAECQHDKLVLSWLSVVLTVLVIVLSAFLVRMAVRPKPVATSWSRHDAETTPGGEVDRVQINRQRLYPFAVGLRGSCTSDA